MKKKPFQVIPSNNLVFVWMILEKKNHTEKKNWIPLRERILITFYLFFSCSVSKWLFSHLTIRTFSINEWESVNIFYILGYIRSCINAIWRFEDGWVSKWGRGWVWMYLQTIHKLKTQYVLQIQSFEIYITRT